MRYDSSTIDYAVMPSWTALYPQPSDDPFFRIRVPLLPDTFRLDRDQLDGHGPEAPDAPLAAPEIVVAAAHPENVAPSALTEVEAIGIDGVELDFAHRDEAAEEREPGMISDLWKGLVDDFFGDKKPVA